MGRIFTTTTMIIVLLLLSEGKAQHSPVFTQYMFNGMAINPAYTGSEDALTLTGSFRKQWLGFKGSPMNQTLSAHTPLKDPRNNVGALIYHDQFGITNLTTAFMSYAFRIDLGKSHRLAMGLQGGISMLQFRYTKLDLDQDDDVTFDEDSPLMPIPRAGFGIYYDHDKFFLGASAPQIIKYHSPLVKLHNNGAFAFDYWLFTGGMRFKLNPEMNLEPSVLVKYIQGSPVQVDANLRLYFKDRFWVAVSYRSLAAISAMFQVRINKQLNLGYAYDYSITRLRDFHFGSHEIILKYNFRYEVSAMSPRRFRE